jgi:hypothetical protein
MSFPKLKKILHKDRIINMLQDNIKTVLDVMAAKPQLDSDVLDPFPIKTGANLVPHNLGKPLSGWKIVDIDAPAKLYRTTGSLPTIYLYLTSDIDCNVTLEVH